jgi:hypothetical protein
MGGPPGAMAMPAKMLVTQTRRPVTPAAASPGSAKRRIILLSYDISIPIGFPHCLGCRPRISNLEKAAKPVPAGTKPMAPFRKA